jgi:hypothetical protein
LVSEKTQQDLAADKGTKDDEHKIDLTLIDPYWEEGVARVMTMGLKKYKRGNWQKGLDPLRILAALKRHADAIDKGETIDKESGLSHSLHIACNSMFLYYYERHGLYVTTEHNKG